MSATSAEPLLVVDDPSFDQHADPGGSHPERPERLVAAREGLLAASTEETRRVLPAREITREELMVAHDEHYVSSLERVFEQLRGGAHGMLDADTFVVPGTPAAALRAAAGAVDMARGLLAGDARRGFALLRPPGHHAEPDRAMGFCLLNNVALAARAALLAGAERVAIVDFDVHHGNGTQHAFEDDPRVLFVSLHQWPLYPGTGAPEETGRGQGKGTTLNLALPSGEGIEAYAYAMQHVVLPALERHRPDLILVSAGFDAHARDPLGSMQLSSDAYGAITSALVLLAERIGHGRVGLVLEGGYDLIALKESVASCVRALGAAGRELPELTPSPRGRAAIERTRKALEQA